jgi:hypothetical protein
VEEIWREREGGEIHEREIIKWRESVYQEREGEGLRER